MPIETELKLRVDDHDAVRATLRAAGAACAGSVTETNTFYDDGTLGDRGLRIRTNRGDETWHVLTFKGPRLPGEVKRRVEHETTVGDAAAMAAVLDGLGYAPRLTFEKRRETWHVGGAEVVLDELPRLGRFVEIEAEDVGTIHAVRDTLGLAAAAVEPRGYAGMIAELGVDDLRF